MELVLSVFAVPVFFVVLYMAARFIFTAYFKTRSDFEKRNNQNGKN